MFQWINDRELVELSAPFHPVERADHDSWFDRIRAKDDVAIFAIRVPDRDELVGSAQLHGIDPRHGTAELQIRIDERGESGAPRSRTPARVPSHAPAASGAGWDAMLDEFGDAHNPRSHERQFHRHRLHGDHGDASEPALARRRP